MQQVPGTRLAHYDIQAKIGSGGMGDVYRAWDTRLERAVAIKLLPDRLSLHAEAKQRFLLEARAASGLEHPNVCTVYAVEELDDGRLLLAMALLEGETLRHRLDRGVMNVNEALDVAIQIADGLAAAHEHGVLHRDIKPANIGFAADGRAVILDFGLAKMPDVDLTAEGTTLGTLAYMSPEQARGKTTDARTDVWSLGVVLYEMLAGTRPFVGEQLAVVRAVLDEDPVPLTTHVPNLSPELDGIVQRCLAKDRKARTPTAASLAEELRALRQPPRVEGTSRKALLGLAAISVVVLAATVAWLWATRAREQHVRTEVLPELERLVPLVRFDMSAAPGWKAVALLHEARDALGDDPRLDELRPRIVCELDLTSEPSGALVRAKAYGDDGASWIELGRTPLAKAAVPMGISEVELELDGCSPVRDILWGMTYFSSERRFVLDPKGSIPEGMVRVACESYPVQLPGLDHLETERMADFLCDRLEVTNADYKRFVDEGAYRKPEFWRVPFTLEGRTLSFAEAMQRFVDRTNLPGPSTWESGTYPDGKAQHPVGGLSWYEAEAFARYAKKELPTIFHWSMVAFTFGSSEIIPKSNFVYGTVEVGSTRGHNRYGAQDLAGNVREWCVNEVSGTNSRFILGGGYNDNRYSFNDAYAADAFDRSPTNGLRCVRLPADESNRERLTRAIETPFRDFTKEKPVDDATFAVYLRQFDYDRTPLEAVVENETVDEHGTRQVVTFAAAYGDERMRALLMLPRIGKKPYQTVVYFPGSNAIHASSSSGVSTGNFKAILASGRAVMLPIYKGTYERGTDSRPTIPMTPSSTRTTSFGGARICAGPSTISKSAPTSMPIVSHTSARVGAVRSAGSCPRSKLACAATFSTSRDCSSSAPCPKSTSSITCHASASRR